MIQSEPYKLICLKHNQIGVSINLGKNIIGYSRLLCYKCLIEQLNGNLKDKSYTIVQIDEFIKDPLNYLFKVMKRDSTRQFIVTDYFSNIEKEIKQLEVKFQQMIAEITKCVNEIKNIKENFFKDFQEQLKLNSIIQQYQQATQLGKVCVADDQRQKEICRFLQHIDYLSGILEIAEQNPKQQEIKQQESFQIMLQNSLNNLIKEIQRFETDTNNSLKFHNIAIYDESIYMELKEFPEIHFQISQGNPAQYELIYEGSPEGLDYEQFHNNHNKQFNLLSIIRTSKGFKFGVYKSSSGSQQGKNFFLFQQNRKEIFKLDMQKDQVILHSRDQAHIFKVQGRKIELNYQLCRIYDLSKYPNLNATIFGEQIPELANIKIYKVTFQR